MSNESSKVRLETESDLKAVLEYEKAMRAAAAATRDLAAAQAELNGGGGGGAASPAVSATGHGGAPPPPPPTHPAIAAHNAARAAAPSATSGVAPAVPAPVWQQIGGNAWSPWNNFGSPHGGGAPTYTGQAPALPPPPTTPTLPPGMVSAAPHETWHDLRPYAFAAGMAAAPYAWSAAKTGVSAAWTGAKTIGEGAWNGTKMVGGAIAQGAETAINVGLGTSLTNFPFAALSHYQELSKTLKLLDSRFREAGASANLFGTQVGYGIARSATIAEALGSTMNSWGPTEKGGQSVGARYAGMARTLGQEPTTVARVLGRMTSMRGGRALSSLDLARMMGVAQNLNMDEGRLDEFLGRYEASATEQFNATGEMNLAGAASAMNLPAFVYGAGTAGAENDSQLTGTMHRMLTSEGPMRAYMMRAYGFGMPGNGMSKQDLDLKLEAGIYDPENLKTLMGSLVDRGVSKGDMYEALKPYVGSAWKTKAIVDRFGDRASLDEYAGAGSEDYAAQWLGGLKDADRATWEAAQKAGQDPWVAMAQSRISGGEYVENRREGWEMNMGSELFKSMPGLMNILGHIGTFLEKIAGKDWGDQLAKAVTSIDRLTGTLAGGDALGFGEGITGNTGLIRAGANNASRVIGSYQAGGIGAGLDEYGEIIGEALTGNDFNPSFFGNPTNVDLSQRRGGSGAP